MAEQVKSRTGEGVGTSPHPRRGTGRVTVNLTARSMTALDETATLTDDTKTNVINKALQVYWRLQAAQQAGGSITIQGAPDEKPVRVEFF